MFLTYTFISIHAPAKGATCADSKISDEIFISIHAPAKGATTYVKKLSKCLSYFNPRTREGCDNSSSASKLFAIEFQSTHPRRVRHHAPLNHHLIANYFNPRTREGCDPTIGPLTGKLHISIHAPAKGATQTCKSNQKRCMISIHAPAKGATGSDCNQEFVTCISIHAPAKGATRFELVLDYCKKISIHAPAKGATKDLLELQKLIQISIHAPAKGATVCCDNCIRSLIQFQSTHPRRVRRLFLHSILNVLSISIHAPAKGATR